MRRTKKQIALETVHLDNILEIIQLAEDDELNKDVVYVSVMEKLSKIEETEDYDEVHQILNLDIEEEFEIDIEVESSIDVDIDLNEIFEIISNYEGELEYNWFFFLPLLYHWFIKYIWYNKNISKRKWLW